ncbi:hypothetical protein [Saccharothrix lopnurensis]|uniref:Uncharacterized protein n=1 Tax=Saccharothrix lopnurensis TaxID=1670621 RepID=A0ABW1NXV7_9PSEU
MPVVPLPAHPDVDQVRKRAKDLLRQVREGEPRALALVAEHAPGTPVEGFTLASAQLAVARHHGFPSWPRLRRHLDDLAAEPDKGTLTVDNRYRVHRGWAEDDDVARCVRVATAAHPPARTWRPVLTGQHAGVRVVVFATPRGPVFAELTPTTTTLSPPVAVEAPAPAFHTVTGTLAGVVPPKTTSVSVERLSGRYAREGAILSEEVFTVPNAFAVDERGVLLRVDGENAVVPVPVRAGGVVDRPGVAGDRESPAGRRLASALARVDVRPVVDPECWAPGAHAVLKRRRVRPTGPLPRPAAVAPDRAGALRGRLRRGPVTERVVTFDVVGNVLEDLPYQQ